MKLLVLIVFVVIIAEIYLRQKTSNVSNQKNMVVDLTYPPIAEPAQTKSKRTFRKFTLKVLKQISNSRLVSVISDQLKVSLVIVIGLKTEDYP